MFSTDLLAGQTILITGGGTGLGRAMAERMAELGARIAVGGRRPEPLQETVEAIRAAGGTAAWAPLDVKVPASVTAAVDALEAELGPITGLVNNAAGNFLCPSEDLSAGGFNSVVQIVMYGSFHCTTELGRRWIARGTKGSVLSILTTYAWMGSGFVLPSAMAKAGVLAMTRSLAVEWAHYGIRCNGIAPGPFPTEGAFSRLMASGMEETTLKRIPAGRFGELPELANLACYLMAPGAAYVTGEIVTIDGGEWLKGGQEFSLLTDWPREDIKAALAAMRPAKG